MKVTEFSKYKIISYWLVRIGFKYAISLLFLLVSLSVSGQNISQPEKVKSATELVIENKGGKEVETRKSFQQFDERGNVTEEIEYEDDGKIKKHSISEYDSQNHKIKETELLPDGKIESITVYAYDDKGNRISKIVTNKDGDVKSKKVYRYEYR